MYIIDNGYIFDGPISLGAGLSVSQGADGETILTATAPTGGDLTDSPGLGYFLRSASSGGHEWAQISANLVQSVAAGSGISVSAATGAVTISLASHDIVSSHSTSGRTAGQLLRAASATTLGWTTATYPNTSTTGQILYSSTTNVVSGLNIGAANTVLTSSGSAPQWSTAISLSGSITSASTIQAAGTFIADSADGTVRSLQMRTSGSLRWRLGANSTAESGSNAGSNFFLEARDDAGTIIDTPLVVVRAAGGAITVTRHINAQSTLRVGENAGAITSGAHLEVSSATGTATITPTVIRIRSRSTASDWDTTNPWGVLDFYSDDASGIGAGVRARIGAMAPNAANSQTSLRFWTSNATALSPALTLDNNQALTAHGTSTFVGAATFNAGITSASANINITGTGVLQIGGTTVITNARALTNITTGAFSSNVTVGGTLVVTGASTFTTAAFSGVATFAAGSSGAPGITFAGDTDTGIRLTGTNQGALVAGGIEILLWNATNISSVGHAVFGGGVYVDSTNVGINVQSSRLAFRVGGVENRGWVDASGNIRPANNLELNATASIIFDGAGSQHTYVRESSNDVLDITVGGTLSATFRPRGIALSSVNRLSDWNTGYRVVETGAGAGLGGTSDVIFLTQNLYLAASDGNWKYDETAPAALLLMQSGGFNFYTVGSGTAGTTAAITQKMIIFNNGNVVIGYTTDQGVKLAVNGDVNVSQEVTANDFVLS